MTREGIEELVLNYARGWKGITLEFLTRIPWLKAFTILDWNINDVSPIHALTRLRMLEVSTYCKTEIRFHTFPLLEDCRLRWREGAESLFDQATIRRLFVADYNRPSSNSFGNLKRLESLSIAGGSLSTLEGLRRLTQLLSLGLYELKQLQTLSGIEGLVNLETLEITGCQAVQRIDEVRFLTQLRRFQFTDNGKVESIKPLLPLKKLTEVYLYGSTHVADGDMSPLMTLPLLEKATYKNRPNYSHTRENLKFGNRV